MRRLSDDILADYQLNVVRMKLCILSDSHIDVDDQLLQALIRVADLIAGKLQDQGEILASILFGPVGTKKEGQIQLARARSVGYKITDPTPLF